MYWFYNYNRKYFALSQWHPLMTADRNIDDNVVNVMNFGL